MIAIAKRTLVNLAGLCGIAIWAMFGAGALAMVGLMAYGLVVLVFRYAIGIELPTEVFAEMN